MNVVQAAGTVFLKAPPSPPCDQLVRNEFEHRRHDDGSQGKGQDARSNVALDNCSCVALLQSIHGLNRQTPIQKKGYPIGRPFFIESNSTTASPVYASPPGRPFPEGLPRSTNFVGKSTPSVRKDSALNSSKICHCDNHKRGKVKLIRQL